MKIQLCTLKNTIGCEYRIEEKLSHIILCSNNPLNGSCKKCTHRKEAEIVFTSDNSDCAIPHPSDVPSNCPDYCTGRYNGNPVDV